MRSPKLERQSNRQVATLAGAIVWWRRWLGVLRLLLCDNREQTVGRAQATSNGFFAAAADALSQRQ